VRMRKRSHVSAFWQDLATDRSCSFRSVRSKVPKCRDRLTFTAFGPSSPDVGGQLHVPGISRIRPVSSRQRPAAFASPPTLEGQGSQNARFVRIAVVGVGFHLDSTSLGNGKVPVTRTGPVPMGLKFRFGTFAVPFGPQNQSLNCASLNDRDCAPMNGP